MAAFLVPTIEAVVDGVPRNSKVYQVSITPTISYRVTVTGEPGVFEDWIAQLKVVECGKFFPVGVAVHGTDRYGNGYLTVCTRLRCIVFQLRFSYGLSRDSMLFLRDVCTCYGWRTDGYNEQLRWRNQRLSLGRLTDIRAIPPPQPNAGLGFFSIMVYGDPVHEPSADWTDRSPSARMQQIGETVMEASICLIMGGTCRYAAPLNESLPRVNYYFVLLFIFILYLYFFLYLFFLILFSIYIYIGDFFNLSANQQNRRHARQNDVPSLYRRQSESPCHVH